MSSHLFMPLPAHEAFEAKRLDDAAVAPYTPTVRDTDTCSPAPSEASVASEATEGLRIFRQLRAATPDLLYLDDEACPGDDGLFPAEEDTAESDRRCEHSLARLLDDDARATLQREQALHLADLCAHLSTVCVRRSWRGWQLCLTYTCR